MEPVADDEKNEALLTAINSHPQPWHGVRSVHKDQLSEYVESLLAELASLRTLAARAEANEMDAATLKKVIEVVVKYRKRTDLNANQTWKLMGYEIDNFIEYDETEDSHG